MLCVPAYCCGASAPAGGGAGTIWLFLSSGVQLVRRSGLPRFEEGNPRPSVGFSPAHLVCPRKNRGHLPRGNVQGRAGAKGGCAVIAPASNLIHGQARADGYIFFFSQTLGPARVSLHNLSTRNRMVVHGLYTGHTYVLCTISLRSPNTAGTTPFLAVGIVLLHIIIVSFGMVDGFCGEVREAFCVLNTPVPLSPPREGGGIPVREPLGDSMCYCRGSPASAVDLHYSTLAKLNRHVNDRAWICSR